MASILQGEKHGDVEPDGVQSLLEPRDIKWPANAPALLSNTKLMAPARSDGAFVDTPDQVREVLDRIRLLKIVENPQLYLDLEGRKLSRSGTISILQIYLEEFKEVYLLDINALQGAAFTTCDKHGVSLKDVLENDLIVKAFFDVRSDSDALFAHYGVKLQGVIDVQLMHHVLESRNAELQGLKKCVSKLAENYSVPEIEALTSIKSEASKAYKNEKVIGTCFDRRPLDVRLVRYCIFDVVMLPQLYLEYKRQLTLNQWKHILEASSHRATESCKPVFVHSGKHGPWSNRNPERLKWEFSQEEKDRWEDKSAPVRARKRKRAKEQAQTRAQAQEACQQSTVSPKDCGPFAFSVGSLEQLANLSLDYGDIQQSEALLATPLQTEQPVCDEAAPASDRPLSPKVTSDFFPVEELDERFQNWQLQTSRTASNPTTQHYEATLPIASSTMQQRQPPGTSTAPLSKISSTFIDIQDWEEQERKRQVKPTRPALKLDPNAPVFQPFRVRLRKLIASRSTLSPIAAEFWPAAWALQARRVVESAVSSAVGRCSQLMADELSTVHAAGTSGIVCAGEVETADVAPATLITIDEVPEWRREACPRR